MRIPLGALFCQFFTSFPLGVLGLWKRYDSVYYKGLSFKKLLDPLARRKVIDIKAYFGI
jgi:hypothetical protein